MLDNKENYEGNKEVHKEVHKEFRRFWRKIKDGPEKEMMKHC